MNISPSTIECYENSGYTGIDVNLSISLFDYGLIWKYNDLYKEYNFIYRVSEDLFNYSCIQSESDFDFINKDDLFSFMGIDDQEWNALELPLKVFYVLNYYGYESIFGSDYYNSSFKISKE